MKPTSSCQSSTKPAQSSTRPQCQQLTGQTRRHLWTQVLSSDNLMEGLVTPTQLLPMQRVNSTPQSSHSHPGFGHFADWVWIIPDTEVEPVRNRPFERPNIVLEQSNDYYLVRCQQWSMSAVKKAWHCREKAVNWNQFTRHSNQCKMLVQRTF